MLRIALTVGTVGTAALLLMSPARASVTQGEPLADAGPAPSSACVKWHGEARGTGYGYRHVVVIENGCKKPAVCSVATDVNPTAISVTVAPSSTEEVVTFLESPVSAFVPNVTCKVG